MNNNMNINNAVYIYYIYLIFVYKPCQYHQNTIISTLNLLSCVTYSTKRPYDFLAR